MRPLAALHHIQINSGNFKKARAFYVKLFRRWQFEKVYVDPDVIGYSDGTSSLWISRADSKFGKSQKPITKAIRTDRAGRINAEMARIGTFSG